MNKYFLLSIVIILSSTVLFSQSIFSSSAGASVGFNYEKSYLWKYEVRTRPSVGAYFTLNYEYHIPQFFFVRVKLGLHQHYSTIYINNSIVKGHNYNFSLPLTIGYRLKEKWNFELGASVQDYRDIEDFAQIKSYNVRFNFILGVSYRVHEKWSVEFMFSRMISEKIDAFVIKNYTDHFMLGVNYILFSPKKKNKRNLEN